MVVAEIPDLSNAVYSRQDVTGTGGNAQQYTWRHTFEAYRLVPASSFSSSRFTCSNNPSAYFLHMPDNLGFWKRIEMRSEWLKRTNSQRSLEVIFEPCRRRQTWKGWTRRSHHGMMRFFDLQALCTVETSFTVATGYTWAICHCQGSVRPITIIMTLYLIVMLHGRR